MPVHVDAEQLRQFADKLQRFSSVLNENMQQTKGQMNQLGDSWKDEGYEQFRSVLAKITPLVEQLVEESKSTIPQLRRDADAIDLYQNLQPK